MKVFLALACLLCCVTNITGQICTQRALFTNLVPQVYTRMITTTYLGRCWRRCVKTRLELVKELRTVQKTVVQVKKFCCDGYMTNSSSLRLQCDPICVPGCENGYCSQPGVCACNEGYAPSPESTRICIPICSNNCDHGTCVEPEKCQCDFGYHSVNDTCVPICSSPCVNGTCVAPDRCECLPGYRSTGTETCYPYCSNGCSHGTCVSPENCVCDNGWHKKITDGPCEPICDHDCGHGTCVSPNNCDCFENYTKTENGVCAPFCSSGCPHGSCVAPENCTCDNGWLNTEPDGVCQPVCENGCVHGTCVSPNECLCLPHYKKSEEGLCVPHCSSGCPHGSCVAPEVCKCVEGWTENGTGCKPVCEKSCGNGSCIAPNACQCFLGYVNIIQDNSSFQDNNVTCRPICYNCYGTCIAPYQCVCEPPFVAENVSVDGTACDCFMNCWEGAKLCDATFCNFASTTTDATSHTEDLWSTFDIDVTFGDDVATDLNNLDEDSTDFLNDTTDNASLIVSKRNTLPYWATVTAAVTTLSIIAIVLTIIVVKRKAISGFFGGGDYYVEGEKDVDSNETLSKEGVKYSDLIKNKETA